MLAGASRGLVGQGKGVGEKWVRSNGSDARRQRWV